MDKTKSEKLERLEKSKLDQEDAFNEYKTYVEAVKANIHCRQFRKAFSLVIANPIARHVQPQLAKREALDLISCFQNMLKNEDAGQRTKKFLAVESLLKGEDASKLINNYVNS